MQSVGLHFDKIMTSLNIYKIYNVVIRLPVSSTNVTVIFWRCYDVLKLGKFTTSLLRCQYRPHPLHSYCPPLLERLHLSFTLIKKNHVRNLYDTHRWQIWSASSSDWSCTMNLMRYLSWLVYTLNQHVFRNVSKWSI